MKKIISILLCFAMLFSLGMMTVTAADDVTVTVNGATSGYTWDAQSKTLTLNNFSTDDGYINIVGSDVTINLIGTNTLTSLTHGIMSNSSITFTGSGNLTVNSEQCSIWTEGNDAEVTFNGTGTITLKSTGREAMFVDGNITFNSGTVDATGANGYPAVVAYGVTKEDALNNISIDTVKGGLEILVNSTMEAKSGSTLLPEVSVGGGNALSKDDYVNDSYLVSEDGYKYSYDSYTGTITKYDQYGNVLDSYAADNATGASWSYVSTYTLNTLSSGSVNYNASNGTYSGDVANHVVVKKIADEKITSTVYALKEAGDTPVIVVPSNGHNVTVQTLKNNLENENSKLTVYKYNGTVANDSENIGTYYKVTLTVDNEVVDTKTIVVFGDVYYKNTSAYNINSQDYNMIKNHIMETSVITDPILQLAADPFQLDGDAGSISSRDYMQIKRYILERNY